MTEQNTTIAKKESEKTEMIAINLWVPPKAGSGSQADALMMLMLEMMKRVYKKNKNSMQDLVWQRAKMI